MRFALGLLLPFLLCFSAAQPQKKVGIKAVAQAGHFNKAKSEYENDYFGLVVRLPEPNSSLVLNGLVEEDRAVLVKAVNDHGASDEWHKFGIDVHSADIPGLVSVTQFVQSLRHQQERDGFQTLKAEEYRTIAGREFVQSELKIDSQNEHYYQAIMVTRTNGYLLCFWIDARTEEELQKATNLGDRIRFR